MKHPRNAHRTIRPSWRLSGYSAAYNCRRSYKLLGLMAIGALLSGCMLLGHQTQPEPTHPVTGSTTPDVTPGLALSDHLRLLDHYVQSANGVRGELLNQLRDAYAANPGATNRLRLSLVLSQPDQPLRHQVAAERHLQALLSGSAVDDLNPDLQRLARLRLEQVQASLAQQAELARLQQQIDALTGIETSIDEASRGFRSQARDPEGDG